MPILLRAGRRRPPWFGPLGSNSYAQSFLAKRLISKCIQPINAAIQHLQDPHVGLILLRNCIQPRINHLHFADIASAPLICQNMNPPTFASTFSQAVTEQHQRLLSHFAGRQLTPYAWDIATSYVIDGGLGLHDVLAANIQGFVFPLARTLQYATQGIDPLKYSNTESADTVNTLQLAPCIQRLYRNWWKSTHPLLLKFCEYGPPILKYHPELAQIEQPIERIKALVDRYPLKATRRRINRSIQQAHFANNIKNAPSDIQNIIPSLMTEYTSIPAASITRTDPAFRRSPPLYCTYLKRKLRLPLFVKPYPICRCGVTVDQYCDHPYNCSKNYFPKDIIHDSLRNAGYHVMRILAPLAGIVSESHDVLHEPDNLISENPLLRPADTGLAHEGVYNQDIDYTLIDYTTSVKAIINDPSVHVAAPKPTTEQVTKLHEYGENKKLNGPSRPTTKRPIAGEILIRKINNSRMILRPWTIDLFGQFGPLAYITLNGKPYPHLERKENERYNVGLGHQPAKDALKQNYHPSAPKGVLPKADKQWEEDLSAQDKHSSTHWFTHTYLARTPSQWGKQVISYNMTKALITYYHRAYWILRSQTTPTKTASTPPTIPGCEPYTIMTPNLVHNNIPGTNKSPTMEI